MKKLTLLVGLILCLTHLTNTVSAQASDFKFDADSNVIFQDVIDLHDSLTTKEILYQKSKIWFANTYKDSKSVIQVDDMSTGHILGKGAYVFGTGMNLFYTVEVYVKNSKYKLYIHDIYFEYSPGSLESLTKVFRDYKKHLIKNPKVAHRTYDFRLSGALSELNNLKFTLGSTLTNKKEDF